MPRVKKSKTNSLRRTSFLIDEVVFEKFKKIAYVRQKSMNKLLNDIVAKYVEKKSSYIGRYEDFFNKNKIMEESEKEVESEEKVEQISKENVEKKENEKEPEEKPKEESVESLEKKLEEDFGEEFEE